MKRKFEVFCGHNIDGDPMVFIQFLTLILLWASVKDKVNRSIT